jgi:mannose-6-phosphate isomerase-like protein (cupin superfamily)
MGNSRRVQPYALEADEGEALCFVGNLVTIKAGTDDTRGRYALIEFLNPPGFTAPPHVHHVEDEAFYILDGHAEVYCGEQRFSVSPGAFVFLPKGVPHWFQVAADAPLRSLVLTAPAQFERYVAEAGEPARARELPPPGPPDVARVALAGDRFQIENLDPPPAPPPTT